MVHLLLLLAATVLACAWAAEWVYLRRTRLMLTGLPSYATIPFFGTLFLFFTNKQGLFRRFLDMCRIMEDRQLPFSVWFGPFNFILLAEPDDVRAVTNAFIEKPYIYNFGRVWLGNGLVTAPGDIWKRSIKKLAGTFTATVVDDFQDVFNKQAQALVTHLKTVVGREPTNIMETLAYTTMETICHTALGLPSTKKNVTDEYYQAFHRCVQLLMDRGLNVFLHPEFLYQLTPSYRDMKRNVAVLHKVSSAVISRRKQDRKKINFDDNENDSAKFKFKTFLDLLLDLKDIEPSLSDEQIRSEVDTIILGGQETVATALFFTLLMIGCKTGVQDKLYAEMKDIFGDSKRPVNKSDLVRMKYCDAVILETLRMYPPIPCVMRYADQDLKLKSCTIPKGTFCVVNGWAAGRSRYIWGDDSNEYKPERWLGETPGQSAGFLAFSYGRRACIGKRYAMALLKTILAHCVRSLIISSEADNLQLMLDVILRPTDGYLIQIKQR